jgi:hypothetical protein
VKDVRNARNILVRKSEMMAWRGGNYFNEYYKNTLWPIELYYTGLIQVLGGPLGYYGRSIRIYISENVKH